MANVAAVILRTSLASLLVVVAACTSTSPAPSTTPLAATTVTTDAAAPETTTPSQPTDLQFADRRSAVEEEAEVFARTVLGDRGEISQAASTLLQQSLGIVLDRGVDGFSMTALDSSGAVNGGLIAFVPERDFRGDPALLGQLGLFISGQEFGTPGTPFEAAGRPGIRLDLPEATWVLWQSHTIVIVAVSESGDFAQQTISEIAPTIEDYAWQTGDCLYMGDGGLPYAPFGSLDLVPCDRPHTHEVLASQRFDESTDATFPEGLSDRVADFCDSAIDGVFGLPPSTLGYDLVRYQPDEDEWAAGDRYSTCLLARADPTYALYELVQPLADAAPPTVIYTLDGCYGLNRRAGALRCEQPHIFQMIGTVTYEGDADTSVPSVSVRRNALDADCDELAKTIVGEPKSVNHRVLGIYDPISRAEWESGVREVPCFAYLIDEVLAPLTVVGKLDGDHTVLGNTDDTIAA